VLMWLNFCLVSPTSGVQRLSKNIYKKGRGASTSSGVEPLGGSGLMQMSATGVLEVQCRRRNARRRACPEMTRRRRSALSNLRRRSTEKTFGTGDIFKAVCSKCESNEKALLSNCQSACTNCLVRIATRANCQLRLSQCQEACVSKSSSIASVLQRCHALASSMGGSCPITLTESRRRNRAQQGACFHPGFRAAETTASGFPSIQLKSSGSGSYGRRRSKVMIEQLLPCVVQLMDHCSLVYSHGVDTGTTDAACVHKVIGKCSGVCPDFRDVVAQASGSCPGALISQNSIIQNQSTRGGSGYSVIEQRALITSRNQKASDTLDGSVTGKCTSETQ